MGGGEVVWCGVVGWAWPFRLGMGYGAVRFVCAEGIDGWGFWGGGEWDGVVGFWIGRACFSWSLNYPVTRRQDERWLPSLIPITAVPGLPPLPPCPPLLPSIREALSYQDSI